MPNTVDHTNNKLRMTAARTLTFICWGLMALLIILRLYSRAPLNSLMPLDFFIFALFLAGILPLVAPYIEMVEFPGGKVRLKQIASKQTNIEQNLEEQKSEQANIEQNLEEQKSEIETMNFLVKHILSKHEIEHLRKIDSNIEFIVDLKDNSTVNFLGELVNLRARELIHDMHDSLKKIENLQQKSYEIINNRLNNVPVDENDSIVNVRGYVYITDEGKKYLEMLDRIPA